MPDILDYIDNEAAANTGQLADKWRELREAVSKRLWHQATEILLQITRSPEISEDGKKLNEIYDNVVVHFDSKMNPLSLVKIVTPIPEQMQSDEEAFSFLDTIGEKVKACKEAFALIKLTKAKRYLTKGDNYLVTKGLLAETEALLDDVEGIGEVHCEFHKLTGFYHRLLGNHAEFYHASLRFLGCTDVTHLPLDESKALALYISLAALLGKNVFNFGELLAHPVLDQLKGTENAWLLYLLKAFNIGDVDTYQKLRAKFAKHPDLKVSEMFLYEKICLLALMNMSFERSATERQLAFSEIAAKTGLPEDKVEVLIMKAQSSGLIKGQIDQVLQKVNVTWVQPRVLDQNQLRSLLVKVDEWSKSIAFMENLIQNSASDILTV